MKRLTITIRVKEPFSAFSHLFGVLLAIAALTLLVTFASLQGTAWHIVSFAIFGSAMILVYVASTLYHWLPLKPSQEKLFRRIDQSMIYLMIAGTYTPIGLVVLKGFWCWSMLGLIWSLASYGIYLQWRPKPKGKAGAFRPWRHAAIYLFMGWVSLVYAYPIISALSAPAIYWLVGGGLAYSVGAVVYGLKWPNPWPRIIGSHEIFHLFVMLGSFCHFWLMFAYVLPMQAR